MEITEAKKGDEEEIAKDFWHPLGKQMEKYSELNKLKQCAVEDALKAFRKQLEEKEYRHFFLEQDGERKGLITIKIDNRPSREKGKLLEIINLYVKDEYRSQGLGTEMIEHAKELAREKDCDFIRTSAEWKNNGARSFYEKNGFEEKQVKYVDKLD